MHLRTLLMLIVCMSAVSVFGQSRMVSHVTNANGGFTTTVQLENTNVVETSITLTPYSADGTALTPYTGALAAGVAMSTNATELFAEGDQVSHFNITDGDGVAVSVVYDFAAGNGSPAHVAASEEMGSRFRIFPGSWDLVFDGVAFVNAGTTATDVWISQKDFNGHIINSQKISTALAPNAKGLLVIGSPDGSNFDRSVDSYFEISADQHMAVTALRGTLGRSDSGLLWANNSRAVSASTSSRDDKGVWFIEGGSTYDVFEMMGYNIASDRLWQLEMFRLLATGRFSEFFGRGFTFVDVVTRTAGYSDAHLDEVWAGLDSNSRVVIQAYVDGINRHIGAVNNNSGMLPLEFQSLGQSSVNTWSYRDVMRWTTYIYRQFTFGDLGFEQINNFDQSIVRMMAQTGGDIAEVTARFNDLRPLDSPSAPTVIPSSDEQKAIFEALAAKRPAVDWSLLKDSYAKAQKSGSTSFSEYFLGELERSNELLKEFGAYFSMGSYSWVVSGNKTDTGYPMLLSSPELNPSAPVSVVEGSIKSDTLTVSGMSVPGVPTFIIGRTPHHTWGVQAGHSHHWDYYAEDVSTVTLDRTETVFSNDGTSFTLPVYFSSHGPMIDPNLQSPYAFKTAHRNKEWDFFNGFLGLARAQSMEEFGEAAKYVGVSMQIMYADKDNNIAYWLAGSVPNRAEGEYRVPQGTVAAPLEWDANDLAPLVHDSNPAQGFYGGWHTKASADWQDTSGTALFGPYNTAYLIQDALSANEQVTWEELKELEFEISKTLNSNTAGNDWEPIREMFSAAVIADGNERRLALLDQMNAWDGTYIDEETLFTGEDADDAARFLRLWIFWTLEHIFGDELAPTNLQASGFKLLQARYQTLLRIEAGATTSGHNWYANISDGPLDTITEVSCQEFEAAAVPEDTLAANVLFGMDCAEFLAGATSTGENWGSNRRPKDAFVHNILGNLHEITFFNRGLYTQLVEMGPEGPTRIESVFPMGQSGTILFQDGQQVFDEHFYDMNSLYENFEMRSFPIFE